MLLKIVALARDICRNFHAVSKANTSNLSDGGVRLTRCLRSDTSTDAAFERGVVICWPVRERIETSSERTGFRLENALAASFSYELIYGRHI